MKVCGFLDSGSGGIPYMLRLLEKTQNVKCVYLGDTANFPYGEKSREEIIRCATAGVKLLVENFSPDAIVTACNTISISALDELRKSFNIPFVGTVPAVKLAAKISRNRKIGLVATRSTVESEYTRKLVEEFAADCLVVKRGDGELVNFVEKRIIHASFEEKLAACRPAMADFSQCDAIILGCTHFVHLRDAFEHLAPPGVSIVDSCDGVTDRALAALNRKKSSRDSFGNNSVFVTSSGREEEYEKLCSHFGLTFGGVLKHS